MKNINILKEKLDNSSKQEIATVASVSKYIEELIGYSQKYNFSDYLHSFEVIYDFLEITEEYPSLSTLATTLLHDLQRAMENYVSNLKTQYPKFIKTDVEGKTVFDIAAAEQMNMHEMKLGLKTYEALYVNGIKMMIPS